MTSLPLSTKKTWFLILAVSPIIWFLLFFLFHFLVLSPITKPMQARLEKEFQQIPLPPQMKIVDYRSEHKTDQVNISAHYDTQLSYLEIFNFYNNELPKQGWQFVEQRDITLGAVERDYCKNDYVLSVDYYGIGYDWKQELWLSWGRPTGCPVVKGGLYQLVAISNLCFLLFASLSWSIFAIITAYGSWTKSRLRFLVFAAKWGMSPRVWRMRIGSLIILIICAFGIIETGKGILKLLL
jgi:hypothetical protein